MRAHYERALELFVRAGPAGQGDLGSAHSNYALALSRAGDVRAAIEHYERALASFEEHWGSDHPNAHMVRLHLAARLAWHGEEDRARALLEQARVGLERALGSGTRRSCSRGRPSARSSLRAAGTARHGPRSRARTRSRWRPSGQRTRAR
ncbi:tetratricopeptide repeat protein [Nannocystis pusilla]|uniref:tetratricopeptide repeat protein n=1 Tax=Nannocystis pusilla TaxID=889268 RepID=UPI003B7DE6B3